VKKVEEMFHGLIKKERENNKAKLIDIFFYDFGFYFVNTKKESNFDQIFVPWDSVVRVMVDIDDPTVGIDLIDGNRTGFFCNTKEEAKERSKEILSGFKDHYKRKYKGGA
jgi:hypothetical protein